MRIMTAIDVYRGQSRCESQPLESQFPTPWGHIMSTPAVSAAAVQTTPFLFRLGSWLNDRHLRGGHRLVDLARSFGQLNRVVQYTLPRGTLIDVPLYRSENCWSAREVEEYEPELIDAFTNAVRHTSGPVRLIDCGADIGTISTVLYSRCPRLAQIVAFEPNPAAYAFSRRNIGRLPIQTQVLDYAVSDFRGRGRLESPPYDSSPHAMFLVPDVEGGIPVTTIDALRIKTDGTLLVKIDTEGTEVNVLRGGQRTIRDAERVVIAFEAHPAVVHRTGIEPCEVLKELREIRPFHARVAEFPTQGIDSTRPLFDQIRFDAPYGLNVVCTSA